jgi:hypothetical protein
MRTPVGQIARCIVYACALLVGSAWAADSSSGAQGAAPYKVEDGTKVDERTLQGWKTWRALACERCHGAQQEGLVGPSLLINIKALSKEQFHELMMKGRVEKGMPPFNTSPMVNQNWEGLYAYLMGRADGKIQAGRLSAIGSK